MQLLLIHDSKVASSCVRLAGVHKFIYEWREEFIEGGTDFSLHLQQQCYDFRIFQDSRLMWFMGHSILDHHPSGLKTNSPARPSYLDFIGNIMHALLLTEWICFY